MSQSFLVGTAGVTEVPCKDCWCHRASLLGLQGSQSFLVRTAGAGIAQSHSSLDRTAGVTGLPCLGLQVTQSFLVKTAGVAEVPF
jgi:hypothetical protein